MGAVFHPLSSLSVKPSLFLSIFPRFNFHNFISLFCVKYFGAFVNILPGKDGLVHISQIRQSRVNDINDLLKVGDIVKAKVIEIDKQHRIRLSIKDAVEA